MNRKKYTPDRAFKRNWQNKFQTVVDILYGGLLTTNSTAQHMCQHCMSHFSPQGSTSTYDVTCQSTRLNIIFSCHISVHKVLHQPLKTQFSLHSTTSTSEVKFLYPRFYINLWSHASVHKVQHQPLISA